MNRDRGNSSFSGSEYIIHMEQYGKNNAEPTRESSNLLTEVNTGCTVPTLLTFSSEPENIPGFVTALSGRIP